MQSDVGGIWGGRGGKGDDWWGRWRIGMRVMDGMACNVSEEVCWVVRIYLRVTNTGGGN